MKTGNETVRVREDRVERERGKYMALLNTCIYTMIDIQSALHTQVTGVNTKLIN